MPWKQNWCLVFLLLCWNIEAGKEQKHGREVSLESCEEGSYVLNECEERCECRDGQLINCYRVRKEFTNMEFNKRRRYINAYKMASMNPAFKKEYEILVALHVNIHLTTSFITRLAYFSHGTDGSWLSSRFSCAESIVV